MGGCYHLFLKVTLANHAGMKQHGQGAGGGGVPARPCHRGTADAA